MSGGNSSGIILNPSDGLSNLKASSVLFCRLLSALSNVFNLITPSGLSYRYSFVLLCLVEIPSVLVR